MSPSTTQHVSTDPRGPFRTIASVDRTPTGNIVTYAECGHTGRLNATMWVDEGERSRCFACAQAAKVAA